MKILEGNIMRKKIRFIGSVIAAATMVFSMAGCGSSQASASKSDSAASAAASQQTSGKQITIGILQIADHEALDSCRKGFLDYLSENGYKDGENIKIDYQNAQGDQSNLKTISQQFVNNGYDYLVGISTPATQSLAAETKDIPIIGTAITSFTAADLVDSDDNPGGNISGVNDETPIADQIALLVKILPNSKTLGILYNSSEVNSQVQAEKAQSEAEKLGLKVEVGTVTSSNDVAQAVESMASKADVMYIPTDNTFASTMATVGQVSEQTKVPVIVGEQSLCLNGGLATIGPDFYELGKQTGKFAIDIFKGEDISKKPVEKPQKNSVTVNKDMAEKLGIEIPQDVLDSADYFVENGKFVSAK
jgi:putative ABC transport system substrate-binding protein